MRHRALLALVIVALILLSFAAPSEAKKTKKKDKAEAKDKPQFTASSTTGTVPLPKEAESEGENTGAAATPQSKLKDSARLRKNEERIAKAKASNKVAAEKRVERKQKAQQAIVKAHEKQDAAVAKRKAADTEENRKHGKQKLHWLKKAAQDSYHNIISVDGSQYEEYVNNGPRPYWLFVVYTALNPMARCGICEVVHEALIPVAEAYHLHQLKNDLAEPIFFIEVEMYRNRELFQKLALQNAPVVVVVPPRLGSDNNPKINQFLGKLPPKYRFTALSPTMDQHDLQDFVKKLAGIDAELVQQIKWLDLTVMGAAAIAVLFLVIRFGPQLREHRHPFLVGAWLAYLFAVSGGMYNIIRNTPFSQQGQNGEIQYIAGGRSQFAAEGYMLGGLNLCCGFFLVLLNAHAFKQSKGEKRREGFTTYVMDVFLNNIGPMGYCAVFLFCWIQILRIYSVKNPGYNMGFVR